MFKNCMFIILSNFIFRLALKNCSNSFEKNLHAVSNNEERILPLKISQFNVEKLRRKKKNAINFQCPRYANRAKQRRNIFFARGIVRNHGINSRPMLKIIIPTQVALAYKSWRQKGAKYRAVRNGPTYVNAVSYLFRASPCREFLQTPIPHKRASLFSPSAVFIALHYRLFGQSQIRVVKSRENFIVPLVK